jgi:DNA invertase Pin-like site-specific DNA recombinase
VCKGGRDGGRTAAGGPQAGLDGAAGGEGLGLEAQRKVIEEFAASRGAEVLARFTEVESGRKTDRPELAKALHLAKVTGATLVIAKLDRLSRNAAFLLALRDSGVRFVAVDMPEANDLTVGIMALVAQAEREAISRSNAAFSLPGPKVG